jgi:hypothetical protein
MSARWILPIGWTIARAGSAIARSGLIGDGGKRKLLKGYDNAVFWCCPEMRCAVFWSLV